MLTGQARGRRPMSVTSLITQPNPALHEAHKLYGGYKTFRWLKAEKVPEESKDQNPLHKNSFVLINPTR